MTTFGCPEFREVAPDLALGLLVGDERGAAISHVAGCGTCRSHLEGLVRVADDLLLLAPSVEPDIGFESRVMARLSAGGAFAPPGPETGRRLPISRTGRARAWSRGPRALLVGIAAALIVVAGVGGGWVGLNRGRDTGRASALRQQAAAANQLDARTVVLRADGGRSTCQLVAFPGDRSHPARLVIYLDEPGEPSGSYQVLAEPVGGGPAVLVGTIAMTGGHGSLAAAIPPGTGPVDAVRVMDSPGTVKYHATFGSV